MGKKHGAPLKSSDRKIKECLKLFDFRKVHGVMVHLNWEWSTSESVPSIAELRQTATELLESAAASREVGFFIGTGGFVARRSLDDSISLHFEVDSSESA